MILLPLLLLSVTDIESHIDGLNLVQYKINEEQNTADFLIEKSNLKLFVEPHKTTTVVFRRNNKTQSCNALKHNVFHLIEGDEVSITADWEKTDDYLVGFFDATGCSFIRYSNFNEDLEHSAFSNISKFCIYSFTKNQSLNPSNLRLRNYDQLKHSKDEKIQRGVLSTSYPYGPEPTPTTGTGFFVFSIVCAVLGGVMYAFIGISFGTECCEIHCCLCEAWNRIDFSNPQKLCMF